MLSIKVVNILTKQSTKTKTNQKQMMNNQNELYENFQEWLDKCPIEINNYLDFTNEFQVTFELKKPIKQTNKKPK